MYIFQLMGGLGNQMFQFAAAKALSVATGKSFKLDFDCPYPHVKYQYNLGAFQLQAEMATTADLRPSKPKRKLLKRIYMLLGKDPNCKLVSEKQDFKYDPAFFKIPDGSYIRGFWQTELYFKGIDSVIRNDFSFANFPEGKNKELVNAIKDKNAVSLHIRRGDYVKVASTHGLHGVCSPRYYLDAIDHIIKNVKDPVFYIFSDDMEWVKNNFSIIAPHYFVDNNNALSNFEDLRLMSLCKHHIIANSSFSWWGAWLNPDREKIVIAPKQWMNDPSFQTYDLIPSSWIRL